MFLSFYFLFLCLNFFYYRPFMIDLYIRWLCFFTVFRSWQDCWIFYVYLYYYLFPEIGGCYQGLPRPSKQVTVAVRLFDIFNRPRKYFIVEPVNVTNGPMNFNDMTFVECYKVLWLWTNRNTYKHLILTVTFIQHICGN